MLTKFYSDIDDLIAQVKQKGEEEDNDAEVQEEYRTKKNHYLLTVVKQVLRRSVAPTKGDKRFLTVLYCCVGLFALMAFFFLFTASDLFAWLMYATMGLIVAVEIALIVWRIRDVARQLKEDV